MSISVQQLNKIKELATQNPEFEFIDKDTVQEIDDALIHATANDLGEEQFRNEKTYKDEQLHEILDDTVKLIGKIQRICIENKQAIVNCELEVINAKNAPVDGDGPAPPEKQAEGGNIEHENLKQSIASQDPFLPKYSNGGDAENQPNDPTNLS